MVPLLFTINYYYFTICLGKVHDFINKYKNIVPSCFFFGQLKETKYRKLSAVNPETVDWSLLIN